MTIHEASRTLLKSPPELWAECSDPASLNRHLDSFGEIRITRLEPETAVAWEGEHASGTVKLEPSGWGTRVILTAETLDVIEAPRTGQAGVIEQPAVTQTRGVAERVVLAEPVGPVGTAELSARYPSAPAAEPAPEADAEEPEAARLAPDDVKPQIIESPAQDQPAPAEPPPRGGLLARLRARLRRMAVSPRPDSESADRDALELGPAMGQSAPAAVQPGPAAGQSEGAQPILDDLEPPAVAAQPEPEPAYPEAVAAQPQAEATPSVSEATQALTGALESLGTAHHRPFSRP
jgi:hypothetical protein